MALLLPPLGGRCIRGPALHVASQGKGRAAHLRVRPVARDPDVDVDAARPGRLGPTHEADRLERLAADHRHVADLRPTHTRHRVQVHPQLVWVVQVVGADGVWIEVDAAQVHDPGESSRVVHHDLRGRAPGRKGQFRLADPVGRVVRRALLEEGLFADTVHESLEGHRPATHAG